MGKFLRSQSEEDTTQAGKIMSAVGKSQAFSAQQRLVSYHIVNYTGHLVWLKFGSYNPVPFYLK